MAQVLGGYDTNEQSSQSSLRKPTVSRFNKRDFLDVAEERPLDVRFDDNDSAPDYIGLNFGSTNATTSSTDWTVFKFTYSGSNVTRIQRQDSISWDNRASGWS